MNFVQRAGRARPAAWCGSYVVLYKNIKYSYESMCRNIDTCGVEVAVSQAGCFATVCPPPDSAPINVRSGRAEFSDEGVLCLCRLVQ